jgi:peptidoglycan-associated lipoprotein
MNARIYLAVSGLALLAAACDSPGMTRKANAPTKNVTGQQGGPSEDALPRLTSADLANQKPGVDTSNLSVSDAIAKACGIPPQTKTSTSFDFDSAQLGDDDRAMLALVAKCLTEGALKGHAVSLIGRADPRGEEEYNMNLGGSRADSVRRYMQDLGVAKDKLSSTSRGELDATGKDEAGWAKDRRVDVTLAN